MLRTATDGTTFVKEEGAATSDSISVHATFVQ